jgi:glycosyltransferase involved in cell wall biosynthesis
LRTINENIAIVLNTSGPLFGGAEKRFSNLFQYLYHLYPVNTYYLVSQEVFTHIKQNFPDYDFNNVIILRNLEFNIIPDKRIKNSEKWMVEDRLPLNKNNNVISDIRQSLRRKVTQYLKSYIKQYYLFRQIEKFRKENDIKVFMGVFSGILPLYFYLNKKKRKTGVIFSDMDSWFSNIYDNDRNYWFKKFNLFNYGLEKSDSIDFLSPFIVNGIFERNIKLNKGSINIASCSFSDYSKCVIGDKKDFVVSYAARIFPDKNPMLYLEAAKIIIKKYPFVKFNLLGEGEDSLQREMVEFVDLNELRNNVFFGFHPNPPEVFSKSTVFVSVQTANNYPSQSVLEAMACGNAIIATDVGDTRMFVNDEVGVLIPLDLYSLVNALELLINDKEYALQLGKNAREFVLKHHTIEKCAEYYLDLFERTRAKIESNFEN